MEMRRLEKWFLGTPLRTLWLRRFEVERVLGGLDVPDGAACLEIGGGQGAGALLIARMLPVGRVVSIDIDPEMVRAAERFAARPPAWARSERADRVEFRQADATALPFDDGTFDLVVLFGVLHHIGDWPAALREAARVLRPGGVLSFEDALMGRSRIYLNRYFRHVPFGADDLRAALESAGLEVTAFRTILLGHWCFVRAARPE